MANDPAFLFYPGDYLRDTQCLSERAQVAYDRIMCEHMRNICITQAQLDFFTKRLTSDEKSELTMVLSNISGGYQITWVAESIQKRREYSESRRKNRVSRKKNEPEKGNEHMKTYVPHMENENENEIVTDTVTDLETWGNLIVAGNDPTWESMRGRKVSRSEMDQFISVAVRCGWKIETAQDFRVSLRGFEPKREYSAKKENKGKLQ